MTMRWHPRRSSARVAACLGLAITPVAGSLFATTASAATLTWTGGGASNNWSDAGNWGGAAPAPGDDLIFAGVTKLTTNFNDFAAGSVFKSISFASGAGAFTLNGNAIHLGVGASGTGITSVGDVNNNSANPQTIGLSGVTLDPGKHQFITNTAALNLALSLASPHVDLVVIALAEVIDVVVAVAGRENEGIGTGHDGACTGIG